MKRFSFPKANRLVSNSQFKAVLANRLCNSDHLLTLYATKNDVGIPRLGISIAKSWASAVTRNRMKRLLRETFRLNHSRIPANLDYLVIVPSKTSNNAEPSSTEKNIKSQLTFSDIEKSFLTLTAQIGKKLG